MYDFTFGKKPTKASQHNSGGANTIDVPVIGIVKDNIDPTRSGTLRVFLSNSLAPLNPNNSDNWVPVKFLSPFFGKVRSTAGDDETGSYKRNPSSYGQWHSPPDIGTKVLCIFNNGDINDGFYIGCVPDPEDLYMIPGIGSSDNIIPNEGEALSYGGATRLPATNFNTANRALSQSAEYLNSPRPVHSYTAAIMAQQGIIRDPIRGPISSSAQREAASRVGWGVSTPGRPIYEGGFNDETVTGNLDPEQAGAAEKLRVISRRGGHSIVMDDGDIVGRDQLVRIRTALGHQILMSDDGQTLMILHSNGQSYIELGKEGTVDVYSTNSINMRSHGDINFHAGRNINLHADEEVNIHSEKIQLDAEEDLLLRAENDIKSFALGNYTVRSDSAVALRATGQASLHAGGAAFVNGSKVNLNSGSASTKPSSIEKQTLVAHTDTLFDKQQGFIAAPGKLMSITSRAPAHAPWVNAGQGVDVEVSLDADEGLPSAPSPAIRDVNNDASGQDSTNPNGVVRAASKLPPSKSVSNSIDQNTTNALLGIKAAAASLPLITGGPISARDGISPTGRQGNNATGISLGSYGQRQDQLERAGYLKPGSDKRIQAAAQQLNVTSATIDDYERILPASVFTGKPGASDVGSLIKNTNAQTSAAVCDLQVSQKNMTKIGAISGKEAPSQTTGIVSAASSFGAQQTSNTLKGISSERTNVLGAIGTGVVAAQAATTTTGGSGGIANALRLLGPNALDTSRGVEGSAFNVIKQSFASLTPDVPQNLTALSRQDQFAPVSPSNFGSLGETASVVQSGAIASLSSLLASGVNSIPGGQRSVASVTNNALDATNILPGTSGISTQITRALGGALPNIPGIGNKGALGDLATGNLLPDQAAQLKSAASAFGSKPGGKTKLPGTSFNTTDRKAISAQVDNLLSDPGIPPPNLVGEVSPAAIAEFEQVEAEGRVVFDLIREFEARQEEINSARDNFYELERNLEPGDPAIDEARQAWFALIDDPDYQQLLVDIRRAGGVINPVLNEAGQTTGSATVDVNFDALANQDPDGGT